MLTRKLNQGLRMYAEDGRYIGRVVVCGFEPGRVKLGFEVDSRFVLLRDELVDAAEDSERVAAGRDRPRRGGSSMDPSRHVPESYQPNPIEGRR